MKVELIGFAVQIPECIDPEEFERHLEGGTQGRFGFRGRERILRARVTEKHLEGLLLTLKPEKTIPLLETGQKEKFEVTVNQLQQGQHLVDFNFFVWSRNTRRGLMQTYFQAPKLGTIEALLAERFAELRAKRVDETIKNEQAETERAKRRIRSRFKGSLECPRLVSPSSLDELIAELNSIDRMEFDFLEVQPDRRSPFEPLRDLVRLEQFSVRFKPDWRKSAKLKAGVRALVARFQGSQGRVWGKLDGEPKQIRFDKNYDKFGEQDFDSVTKEVAMNLEDWPNSPFLKYLKTTMSDHRDMFLTRPI